jgi:hypothetical protein
MSDLQTEEAIMPEITTQDEADEIVREVAALLPFTVELDAVMGYTGALFIDLGRRGGVDDPPDTAGIDLEVEPVVWMFDVEGGRETIASDLDHSASAEEVARWIAAEAQRFDSPATHSLN